MDVNSEVSAAILQRIAQLPVLPELRAVLVDLVERDWNTETSAIQNGDSLQTVLMLVYQELGGADPVHLQPLLLAWHTLRAAILRLDHIQDDDPEVTASFGGATSMAERYNLTLTYYLLATAMLDDLNEQYIPALRIRRLLRMWNESLLRAASGQQRDLANQRLCDQPQAALEYYEQAIRAKAGSIYSIGFGGVAALATDDQAALQALPLVGELYGTLLQLNDDLLDAAIQVAPALTLPHVYQSARAASGIALPPHTAHHFARLIFRTYFEHVSTIVAWLPVAAQEAILSIFRQSFPLIDAN